MDGLNKWCETAAQALGKSIGEHPALILIPKMTPAVPNTSKKNLKYDSRRKHRRIFTVRMGKVFLFIIGKCKNY